MASEEKISECFFFFANLMFLLPWQPIKISSLDKIHMYHWGLLQEQFYKTFVQISPTGQKKNTYLHFSHFNPMEILVATAMKAHEQWQ